MRIGKKYDTEAIFPFDEQAWRNNWFLTHWFVLCASSKDLEWTLPMSDWVHVNGATDSLTPQRSPAAHWCTLALASVTGTIPCLYLVLCIALHYISLHYITFYYITSHCITLHHIALPYLQISNICVCIYIYTYMYTLFYNFILSFTMCICIYYVYIYIYT